MARSKLKLVNLVARLDKLEPVLERLVSFGCLELVPAEKIIETVHGSKPHITKDLATPLLTEIDQIESGYHTKFDPAKIAQISDSFQDMSHEIHDVHHKLDSFQSQRELLQGLYTKYNNAYQHVQYLSNLSVSLDDIFACEYIVSRVGKLSVESVERLKYYQNTPFIFQSFAVEDHTSWCMYFTTNQYERAVDNIFSSLLFERVYIPDFVHGTPEEALKSLELELKETQHQLDLVNEQTETYLKKHQEIFCQMKSELKLLAKMHEAEVYVVELGGRFSIVGFIDQKDVELMQKHFGSIEGVEIEVRPADADKRLKAPKKISRKACVKSE